MTQSTRKNIHMSLPVAEAHLRDAFAALAAARDCLSDLRAALSDAEVREGAQAPAPLSRPTPRACTVCGRPLDRSHSAACAGGGQ